MKYLLILMLLIGTPLSANCVAPEGYAGDVDQLAQKGVIIHRAPNGDQPGYQEMLLRIVPDLEGEGVTPSQLAWVLPVPNKPVVAEFKDRKALDAAPVLHEKLYQLARMQWRNRTRFVWPESWTFMEPGRKAEGPADPTVTIDATYRVGGYEISEIEASGKKGVTALNAALRGKGFPAFDSDELSYFAENGFFFLCITLAPRQGDHRLGDSLDLAPLAVGFETDQPYYPALLCAGQGNFALDLTLITDTPLKNIPLEYTRVRLGAERRSYVHLLNLWSVQPLPEELADAFTDKATAQPDMWFVNRIESYGFNDGEDGIASWEDDVFFELGDYNDAVAGFWYYGDDDVTYAEQFFREHALAIMVVVGVLLFGGLFIKTRINRKRMQAEQD